MEGAMRLLARKTADSDARKRQEEEERAEQQTRRKNTEARMIHEQRKAMPTSATNEQSRSSNKSPAAGKMHMGSHARAPLKTTTLAAGASSAGGKKMSFKDLMNQAATVDTEALKLNVKVRMREKSPLKMLRKEEPSLPTKAPAASSASLHPRPSAASASTSPALSTRPLSATSDSKLKPAANPTPPFRPGNTQAPGRDRYMSVPVHSRKRHRSESASSLDSFVAYDEEGPRRQDQLGENENERDEIWRIFHGNRARPKYHDEDCSDDMEATGEDIFKEEFRSEKVARHEDAEEERRERELWEAKRRRMASK